MERRKAKKGKTSGITMDTKDRMRAREKRRERVAVELRGGPDGGGGVRFKLAMFKIATFKIAMFKIATPILLLYWPVRVV